MRLQITLKVFQTVDELPEPGERVLAFFQPVDGEPAQWMIAARGFVGWHSAQLKPRRERDLPTPSHWAELPPAVFGPMPGCALDMKTLTEHWRKQWDSVANSIDPVVWGPPWNQDPLEKMPDLDD